MTTIKKNYDIKKHRINVSSIKLSEVIEFCAKYDMSIDYIKGVPYITYMEVWELI